MEKSKKKIDLKAYARSFHEDEKSWENVPVSQEHLDNMPKGVRSFCDDLPTKPLPDLQRTGDSSSRGGYIYYLGDGNGRVKIGFSANPWSRLREGKCFNPTLELLATEKATSDLEWHRHQDFKEDHLALEWFRLSPRLERFIKALINLSGATKEETPESELRPVIKKSRQQRWNEAHRSRVNERQRKLMKKRRAKENK